MALSPLLDGTLHDTAAEVVAGRASTPVGGAGTTGWPGVTAFDAAEVAPHPLGLQACTVNVYVVPAARPVTVVVVSGGVPVIVFAVWLTPLTRGVMT